MSSWAVAAVPLAASNARPRTSSRRESDPFSKRVKRPEMIDSMSASLPPSFVIRRMIHSMIHSMISLGPDALRVDESCPVLNFALKPRPQHGAGREVRRDVQLRQPLPDTLIGHDG